jgi:3alpha(or 20beta)-hydroxysteroid dehydrogenase
MSESVIKTAEQDFAQVVGAGAVRREADDRTWNRLEHRVVLITGGARGLGAAQAKLFAAEGARVVIADILDDRGEQLADEIGERAIFAHVDIGRDDEWTNAIGRATEAFGPVDAVVHNAAVASHGLIEQVPAADFAAALNINLVGAYRAIQASVGSMTAAGGGSIVLISSIESLASHAALAAYCAAKAGVVSLARTAALELASRNIRVNALCPGVVDTEMVRPAGVDRSVFAAMEAQIPLGRVAEPVDLARAALFLVSDDGRYVTGASLVADGGVMAKMPLSLG